MPFNSYPYIVFIIIVVLAFLGLERRFPWAKRAFLLLVSYGFYAWWRADFVLLLVGSTIVNYALGGEITRRHALSKSVRELLLTGLVFNLGLIGLFKYAGLFVASADGLLGLSYPIPHLFLPLAISFFTFEQISYLVDAADGKAQRYSFLDYALFVSYFPHLIAGPIVRYNDLIPQFAQSRTPIECGEDMSLGVTLFTIGLAKKTLIADNLAPFADVVFAAAHQGTALSATDAWLGTLFFAFQIYFDFSAYTDMALGSSCMLGIRLPFNFNAPYKSESIIEFWRRWHISLSTFLRDYLYFKLGGNRKGTARRYANLMITMLLGGLWHGANWTFMIWGGLHGFYLIVNHAWRSLWASARIKLPSALRPLGPPASVFLTFAATTVAWVVFRADDFPSAILVLRGLCGQGGQSSLITFSPLAASALVALFAIVWFAPNSMEMTWSYRPALDPPKGTSTVRQIRLLRWQPSRATAVTFGLVCIAAVLALSNLSPFIYFQF
ncbi:MAG: MBOAT family protein [Alphaproteobacteria bacterium]|nr:MBOAT family protein [Alphaproteobacteria bacterium]